MPQISVIVTTYNRPKLVEKTILSILDQTFLDFELIIIDNFSSYDFLSLINNINDKRIRAFQNQNNGVIAVNRNFGLNLAKGKYIAFCDDDDIWHENKLEVQINLIKQNKLKNKHFVIYSNCLESHPHYSKKSRKGKITTIRDFIYTNQIPFSSSLISNLALKQRFNEEPSFVGVEDYVFWMNLKMNKYNFYLQEEFLVTLTVDKTSASQSNYGLNHISTIIALASIFITNKGNKINSFDIGFSILRESFKFLIKKLI